MLALRDLPDALPGRMETVELWPFSQGEIDASIGTFIDAAFRHGPQLSRTSTLHKRDYLDRVARGGFPEATRRTARRQAAFFEAYLTNLNRYLELLTMVFLIKQIPAWSTNHTQRATLFHYRTKDKLEVDACQSPEPVEGSTSGDLVVLCV